jgi:hypothetical protein
MSVFGTAPGTVSMFNQKEVLKHAKKLGGTMKGEYSSYSNTSF